MNDTSRVVVISPHLDDAVFSCGSLLAASPGAVVCTVFAGTPPDALVTDWDRQCGFANAHQAMRARYAEDDASLEALGASPVRLGFLDSQYVSPEEVTSKEAIADALAETLRELRPGTLYIPLGLFHSDHALVHEASLDAWLRDASLPCIAYEDCLYRRMSGLVQTRIAELAKRGIVATPSSAPLDAASLERAQKKKRVAVSHYASQLRAFGPNGYDDVHAPERAWTLQAKADPHAD